LAHNYANEPGFWGSAQRFKDRFTGGFDFVAYQPELPRLMRRAREADLGVMVMKTRRGARYNDLSDHVVPGGSEAQAAFRWVLSNSDVHGLVVTMDKPEVIDEYLGASGARTASLADTERLVAYEARNSGWLCQPGCAACTDACPASVDVAGTLRTRMYAQDYGRPEIARTEYAALGAPAAACLGCRSSACVGACPAGIDIPRLARRTHRALG